jgi:NADH dehydrogenase [ubiquinone] 1 alpha subcomplex assembly factor 5
MSAAPKVFDRRLLRLRRERAAATLGEVAFLIDEVTERLVERLETIRRTFPLVLDLGSHDGRLAQALAAHPAVGTVVRADLSGRMLARSGGRAVVADEELLPFGPDSFDAVFSVMSLHWVNDLPGTLAQIRWCLKPDGLMLLAFPGGGTLRELRAALLRAELELTGGASPRVAPFVEIQDAAALLQRVGLALPVADVDRITVGYGDPLRLLLELRRMGEASVLVERRRTPLGRAVLARALELYRETHGNAEGRVPATFDILFLTGWKPHASQPQPLRRGSGRVPLADAFARIGPHVAEGGG